MILYLTLFVTIAVIMFCFSGKKNDGLAFFTGLLALISSLMTAYVLGTGNLLFLRLDDNAIYERVVAKEVDGKVVAILRKQNGNLFACELKKLPPPIFKMTDNENDPYQPYPPNPK